MDKISSFDLSKYASYTFRISLATVIRSCSFFITEQKRNLISLLSSPYVTGHRGSGNTTKSGLPANPAAVGIPENTVAAFKWALDNGADSVEIDIHTTKDNELEIKTEGIDENKVTFIN